MKVVSDDQSINWYSLQHMWGEAAVCSFCSFCSVILVHYQKWERTPPNIPPPPQLFQIDQSSHKRVLSVGNTSADTILISLQSVPHFLWRRPRIWPHSSLNPFFYLKKKTKKLPPFVFVPPLHTSQPVTRQLIVFFLTSVFVWNLCLTCPPAAPLSSQAAEAQRVFVFPGGCQSNLATGKAVIISFQSISEQSFKQEDGNFYLWIF